ERNAFGALRIRCWLWCARERARKRSAAAAVYSSAAPTFKRERRSVRGRFRVTLAEFVDAPAAVDDLLLAGIERMAGRADFDVEVLAEGRARREFVAAATDDFYFGVVRVDLWLHGRGSARGAEG